MKLDKPVLPIFASFGPFQIDGAWNIYQEGIKIDLHHERRINTLPVKILLLLIANEEKALGADDLGTLMEGQLDRHGNDRKQKNFTNYISILRGCLGDSPRVPKYIETITKPRSQDTTRGTYRFLGPAEITSEGIQAVEVLRRMARSQPAPSEMVISHGSNPESPLFSPPEDTGKIDLSIDGIILNSVAELVFETVPEAALRRSKQLYTNCLQDFAFAVVYASKFSSNWIPPEENQIGDSLESAQQLPPSKEPNEAASHLISLLPRKLFRLDVGDPSLGGGRVLQTELGRNRVSEYIRAFGKAMHIPSHKKLCGEWLLRDAHLYLGDHPNLFRESDNPDDFEFKKDYYQNELMRHIPQLLGGDILMALTEFLPKGPGSDIARSVKENYSSSALAHFVVRCVLTHITIMYEYEVASERNGTRRVPFVLRGVAKRQWNADHHQQRELRHLLVRAALTQALEESEGIDGGKGLVDALLQIRELSPFLRMRKQLEELDLMELMPSEANEREARRIIADIRTRAENNRDQTENIMLDRTNAVRYDSIGIRKTSDYYSRLYKLFPALMP